MKSIAANFACLRIKRTGLIISLMLLCFFSSVNAQGDERRYVSLEGIWKFSIGDDIKWSKPGYNDSEWEEINAPALWEEQGFNGFDGYAWYRKHFFCPKSLKGKALYLHMGFIDDVDQVYINGKLVGSSGSFPPNYFTAYNAYRRYPLPESFLNINSDNIISVRVYDVQMAGGIVSGELGIYAVSYPVQPDIVLEGLWKFHTEDNMDCKNKNYPDNSWNQIIVPGNWENQGYPDFDGIAWYRKAFTLPDNLKSKTLVLLLGKIDDKDEVYLNGRLIGHTGNLQEKEVNDYNYQQFRGYFIPSGVIQKENVIAIRVYDGFRMGGIFEGPVGVMTQEKYNYYWKVRRQQHKNPQKNFWELIFGQ